MEYFVSKILEHCPPPEQRDELYDEYCVYQSLPGIPSDLLSNLRSTGNSTNEHEDDARFRADVLWHELEQRDSDGKKKFGLLAPIAKLVLYHIAMLMKSEYSVLYAKIRLYPTQFILGYLTQHFAVQGKWIQPYKVFLI